MKYPLDKKDESKKGSDKTKYDKFFNENNYKMRIVGEVCIVVLGILFAILIYHWNETKNKNTSLLEKIKQELSIDIGYADNFKDA